MVSDPAMGDCTNDTIMFSGFDANSMKVVPMSLCGTLSGQHSKLTKTSNCILRSIFSVVVNVKDATEGAKIVFNIVSMASMAKWRVKVDHYDTSR